MSIVPKATKKLAIRFVICLFTLALIFAVYNWMRSNRDLGDFSNAKTQDWLLAIEQHDEGQQAVIFKEDGTMLRSPDYKPGKTDRDTVWRPDGSAVYMSSDRETEDLNIYRWNLQHNVIERRGIASRSQLGTNFGELGLGASNTEALIISGGFVLKLNPKEATTEQVLPPVGHDIVTSTGEEGAGGSSQFDAFYKKLGSSFREARWGKDKEWVYAVMRGDDGETLIAQQMGSGKPPVVLGMGDRIDFDVNPRTGSIVYSILGVRVPMPDNPTKKDIEAIKELTKVPHRVAEVRPWEDSQNAVKAIAVSPSNKLSFARPKIAPDGNSVLVSVGKYVGDGNQAMDGIISIPIAANGLSMASAVIKGEIYDYSWSPTGKKFAFIQKDENKVRSIFVFDKDSGKAKKLSDGKSNYLRPLYSPQAP